MKDRLPNNGSPSTGVLREEVENFREAKIKATLTGEVFEFQVDGESFRVSDIKRDGCVVEPLTENSQD